jgi:hypothetical protein
MNLSRSLIYLGFLLLVPACSQSETAELEYLLAPIR